MIPLIYSDGELADLDAIFRDIEKALKPQAVVLQLEMDAWDELKRFK